MRRMARWVLASLAMGSLVACQASAPASPVAAPPDRAAKVEDAVADDTEMVVVLRPRALFRDRVYGPLLRKAAEMASLRVGVSAVGATALVAFERSEEIVVATRKGGLDAVVGLRGAPADVDPSHLVDDRGASLWTLRGEVRPGVVEFAAEPPPSRASLFELNERTWVIAAGDAVLRARAAFSKPRSVTRALVTEGDELGRMFLPGSSLRSFDPRLRDGALSPIGKQLDRATVSLLPGAEGLMVVDLSYGAPKDAAGAEACAREVVDAFRRRLLSSDSADGWTWVAAATIERREQQVSIRVPLPRSWLRSFADTRASLTSETPAKTRDPFDTPPAVR